MAKKSVSDALSIPSISFPNFKKCYGLELYQPQLDFKTGFVYFSTEMLVTPAHLPCTQDD